MAGPGLLPCPFCGTTEHLRLSPVGSMTAGMPDRPHQVRCRNIACEDAQGPIEYGQYNAIAAWNRRAPTPLAAALAVPEVQALMQLAEDRLEDDCDCGVCSPIRAALAALKGGA